MSKTFFITGIDTDTGKTVVTAGILRYLRNRAINSMAMKPVQTGCSTVNGIEILPDIEVYKSAADLSLTKDELKNIVPYCYEMPSSPHLAAEKTGDYPALDVINNAFNKLKQQYDSVLVEGAGGLLVPLNPLHSMLDLIKKLNIPVLVVVDNRLGMINHSLLTIEVLKQHNIEIMGFIVTNSTPIKSIIEQTIRLDNCKTIANLANLTVLAEIPFIKNFDIESTNTWNQIENVFDSVNLIDKLGN